MWLVGAFLLGIIVLYVVIEYYNNKRREAHGICKTTGSTCTSKVGCTCSDGIESHQH